LSIQFAAVSLYDNADAIQTKTIMALAHFPKRFAPPILGRQVKTSLGFTEIEEEFLVIDFRSRNKPTFTTIVPEGVGENLAKCFLEKLRINIQHRVTKLNFPGDLLALFWEIVVDLSAQVLHKIRGRIRDHVRSDLPHCSGKPL
jgi:hypothetical protein